ncbi:hypothetical protein [Neisseria sicca]|uniref:hypothetical protein n=1 Tax=Neisseria sicca TaxID=490 RepID=UPI000366F744|nr:hypothetical protein [Neisseria sicca]
MTQQFKFGDMVKSRMHPNKTLGLVVDAGSNQYSYIIRWEHTKGVSQEHAESLELIPHPDTLRLDFIERVINIDGMVKRQMMKGWVLVDDDIDLTTPKPLLRDAIDAAMRLEVKYSI